MIVTMPGVRIIKDTCERFWWDKKGGGAGEQASSASSWGEILAWVRDMRWLAFRNVKGWKDGKYNKGMSAPYVSSIQFMYSLPEAASQSLAVARV